MKNDKLICVGVLALQGDFSEHLSSLRSYGVQGVEIRNPVDLEPCDALILPGGESTVISKLMKLGKMDEAIVHFVKCDKKPLWGSCAGAILLANKVVSSVPLDSCFGLLDITIERNAYGRQFDSFKAFIDIDNIISDVIFIRAPRILEYGRNVQVLCEVKGDPVFVRSGMVLASTFHSELLESNLCLEMLLSLIKS